MPQKLKFMTAKVMKSSNKIECLKTVCEFDVIEGIKFTTAEIGFKYKNRLDYLLIDFDDTCSVAGVFTKSKTCSSAVIRSRELIKKHINDGHKINAIVINSGNSNAFTGDAGRQSDVLLAKYSGEIIGVDDTNVLSCSTGVIGEVLDTSHLVDNLENIKNNYGKANSIDAGGAILTTDTFVKTHELKFDINGKNIVINGISKGSGMIEPDMATMLAYVFTNAKIDKTIFQSILKNSCDASFNSITVDGDTSTSDSVIAVATNAVVIEDYEIALFEEKFKEVCMELAHKIIIDGEGATKFIEVNVNGCETLHDANLIAKSIANSPLVKTAIAGCDPNWGRIVMAVGKSGANVIRDKLDISIGGILIASNGVKVYAGDEADLKKHINTGHVVIDVNVNIGSSSKMVWTCDLTHEYISINADYRS